MLDDYLLLRASGSIAVNPSISPLRELLFRGMPEIQYPVRYGLLDSERWGVVSNIIDLAEF
jgi:hypothetical protein